MKLPFVSRKKYESLQREVNLLRPTEDNVTIDIKLTEPFTQESYETIKKQLEEIVQRINLKAGGLYSSVYIAKVESVLADLRTKIVPVNQSEEVTAGAIAQSTEEHT